MQVGVWDQRCMIVTLPTQRVQDLGQMSGAATRKVLRRQWQEFGDARFERLTRLSNGHLYNNYTHA